MVLITGHLLMQESFWWWQCDGSYNLPLLPPPGTLVSTTTSSETTGHETSVTNKVPSQGNLSLSARSVQGVSCMDGIDSKGARLQTTLHADLMPTWWMNGRGLHQLRWLAERRKAPGMLRCKRCNPIQVNLKTEWNLSCQTRRKKSLINKGSLW